MNHNHKNKLVIILVNYNGFSDTSDCLMSIKRNEEDNPFVIIVDNSEPKDESLEQLKSAYDQLHIIHTNDNRGFGCANNIGINWALKNVDFEHIALLNNDTIITLNALSNLTTPFNELENIGIVTGKIMYQDRPDLVWYGGGNINYTKGWPEIDDIHKEATSNGANSSKFVTFASGCLMMFSKNSILKIKGFDPVFFMYCEDLELCMRATKLGYKIFYKAESTIYHKVNSSITTDVENSHNKEIHPKNPNSNFLFYHMRMNQMLTMKKHLSNQKFLRFALYFWAKFFYITLWMLFNGKLSFFRTSIKTCWQIITQRKKIKAPLEI